MLSVGLWSFLALGTEAVTEWMGGMGGGASSEDVQGTGGGRR